MKRLIIAITTAMLLTSCSPSVDALQEQRNELSGEIKELQAQKKEIEIDIADQRNVLNTLVVEEKIKTDTATYILKLKVGVDRFALDFDNRMKDALNEFDFDIIVSKDFYSEVNVGDRLNEKLRIGSIALKGSYGNQYVQVIEKRVE